MDKREIIVDNRMVEYTLGTTIINLDNAKRFYKGMEYITTTSTYFVNGERIEKNYPIHFFK